MIFAEEFGLQNTRQESIWPRVIAIALAAVLVGAGTIILMSAAVSAPAAPAFTSIIHHQNGFFDVMAVTLLGFSLITVISRCRRAV